MATEWQWKFIFGCAADKKNVGKAFIKLASPFPNDPGAEDLAFEGASELVPLGQPDGPTVGYFIISPCRKELKDTWDAIKGNAALSDSRYDWLKARGITLSQYNALKAATLFFTTFRVRDAVTNEPVEPPMTLDEYLAARGYQVKPPPEVSM